jgi:membrane fusion protein (multidrug efflux system)
MPDGVAEEVDLREEVRRLKEEQERLKNETAVLLKKSAQPNGGQPPPSQQTAPQGKQDDQPEKKKETGSFVRNHPVKLVVIVIVLIAAGIGGFLLLQYLGSYVSTDDAEVEAHINAVTSRINGTVVGVYAEDNQWVKAGQTLVDIDPRDYKVALVQTQAQLAQAVAGIDAQNPNVPITQTSQETNITASNEDVTNAEAALSGARQTYQSTIAQLRQAEANYDQAASDEARYRELVKKDEVSKEQYDAKLAAKKADQAIVDAQRANADAAKQTIAQREAALAQAKERAAETRSNAPRAVAIQRAQLASKEADVNRVKADVDQASLNLSYTKILAPVNGIFGRRSVEIGQQVAPGQQLGSVTDLNDIWVTANFKETQLRDMKPNQSVRIHVDAINADFDGYVESLPGASGAVYSLLPPENATGNYVKVVQRLPVRIRFKPGQNGLDRLRPGMSVEPKVNIHSA